MSYRQFIFENYQFDTQTKVLSLHYSLDGTLNFTETYTFNFDFADYSQAALDRAFALLFLVAGVSYYKTYVPSEIIVKKAGIDQSLKEFLDFTYQNGLGEFFYVNQLDPRMPINFPVTLEESLPIIENFSNSGLLVGLGGGKDSLVSVELLREKENVTTWSLNHTDQMKPLVERVGLPHYFVEREWDASLKDLPGAYNGHVPISAIFACVGTIVAILTGKQYSVVSNEQSSSEPTLTYDGLDINHQFSKSLAFEIAFQQRLTTNFGSAVGYFSFLRPLSELKVAELFSKRIFEKYHDVFSSCNRAYVKDSRHMFWCGECPKCAFVFLILAPFIEREKLENLFGGKNLLLAERLRPTYNQLLGIAGDKPLECVGEIKESRAAMRLTMEKYTEITPYEFDLPVNYNYKTLGTHRIPPSIYDILTSQL